MILIAYSWQKALQTLGRKKLAILLLHFGLCCPNGYEGFKMETWNSSCMCTVEQWKFLIRPTQPFIIRTVNRQKKGTQQLGLAGFTGLACLKAALC